MNVSIIIVNYKTARLVTCCIRSIQEHTTGITYEIIVVDNNSGDDISEMITKEFGQQVKILLLDTNIGFGQANNEGVKMATGRNILFLNPDTLLLGNAIKILSDILDSYPDAGACGGNLYDETMKPALSFRRIFPGIRYELSEMTAHKIENIFFHGNWMFNHTDNLLKVAYITGADLMVRRSVLDQTGGFSPCFFMYNEDTDLCLRIHQHDYDIISIPSAKIQHLEGKSTHQEAAPINEKGLFLSEQGRYNYYSKNASPLKQWLVNTIYLCSLRLLCFVSRFTTSHNTQAFKYRIKAYKELHG